MLEPRISPALVIDYTFTTYTIHLSARLGFVSTCVQDKAGTGVPRRFLCILGCRAMHAHNLSQAVTTKWLGCVQGAGVGPRRAGCVVSGLEGWSGPVGLNLRGPMRVMAFPERVDDETPQPAICVVLFNR